MENNFKNNLCVKLNYTYKKGFYFLKFSNVYLFASFKKCPVGI